MDMVKVPTTPNRQGKRKTDQDLWEDLPLYTQEGEKCCTFLQGRQMLLLARMIGATFPFLSPPTTNGPIAR